MENHHRLMVVKPKPTHPMCYKLNNIVIKENKETEGIVNCMLFAIKKKPPIAHSIAPRTENPKIT